MHPYLREQLARSIHEERIRLSLQQQRAVGVKRLGVIFRLLHRGRRRAPRRVPALAPGAEIRIRPASTEEAIALQELPAPAGAPASIATVLMAEVDGAPAAAWSLDTGLLVPVAQTPPPELQELLHLRAVQLRRIDAPEDSPSSGQPPDAPRRFTRRDPS
jgi:hypothetical protein